MKETRSIKKGSLNNRQVKFFEVWKFKGHAWFFDGKYAAPVKISNKNLIKWVQDN